MKSKRCGAASSYWFLVSLAVATCRHDAQASSLRATAAGTLESSATLDVAQAQDKLAQRAARIGRMETLGTVEMQTLLRQQKAVEMIAAEEASVKAQEKKLEETQQRISKKLELLSQLQQGGAAEGSSSTVAWLFAAVRNATEGNASTYANSTGASQPEPKPKPIAEMNDREIMLKVVWGRQSFVSMLFYLCVTMLVGAAYGNTKPQTAKLPNDEVNMDHWQYKLLDCHDCDRDWPICCWAMCCGAVRWADTVANPAVAFMTFWPALIFFEVMSGMTVISLGISGLILVAVAVNNRQKIRRTYGIPHGTVITLCWDIIAWSCCACCAIAQEARQVDLVEVLPPDLSGRGGIPNAPPQHTMIRPDGPLNAPEERGPAEPVPDADLA